MPHDEESFHDFQSSFGGHGNKVNQSNDENLKSTYVDELKKQSPVTAKKLVDYINKNHPKQVDTDGEPLGDWSLCENVGTLFSLSCCQRNKVTRF